MLDIIFEKKDGNFPSLKEQRLIALSLISKITGHEKIDHTKSGRPIVGSEFDISISHKNDAVCIGVVSSPSRIGVDVEHIDCDINCELFLKTIITEKEKTYLDVFCKKNNINQKAGVAILWSIKESFFKCLDHDLIPGKISIIEIDDAGLVKFEMESSILSEMINRGLQICHVSVSFNEKHVYSIVAMKKI